MGTNYYAETNLCEHCARSDSLHIGKSSYGWTFTFRSHPDHEPPLTTADAWRDFLLTAKITDEYGEPHDYAEFWGMVEAKRNAAHNHAREYPSTWDHLDEHGNSFSDREFS